MKVLRPGQLPDRDPRWVIGVWRCPLCGAAFEVDADDARQDLSADPAVKVSFENRFNGESWADLACPYCHESIKLKRRDRGFSGARESNEAIKGP